MYPYYFINCKKYKTLTQDVDNKGSCEWGRRGV